MEEKHYQKHCFSTAHVYHMKPYCLDILELHVARSMHNVVNLTLPIPKLYSWHPRINLQQFVFVEVDFQILLTLTFDKWCVIEERESFLITVGHNACVSYKMLARISAQHSWEMCSFGIGYRRSCVVMWESLIASTPRARILERIGKDGRRNI